MNGGLKMKRFISVLLVMIISAATLFALSGCNKDPAKEYEGIRFIYEEIVADDNLLETYAADPYRYRDIISEDFGIGESGADNFYENFADYYIYGMTVKVLNYTGSELVMTSLESDSNGKNGVYLRKTINGGENGIGAKLPDSDFLADAITVHILNSNIELSDAQVVETVKAMNLTVTCSDGTKYDLRLEDNVEITQNNDSKAVLNLRGLEFGVVDRPAFTDAAELESTYGMSAKDAQKFLKNTDGSAAYSYTVSIENLCDKDIVIYDVSLEKNGKNGIYAKATLGSEIGVPAHNPEAEVVMPPFIINVLCTEPDMLDSDVLGALDEAKITVTYAEKTVNGDEMNDEVGERKTVTVNIL